MAHAHLASPRVVAKRPIPVRAGVGLKADHYHDILSEQPDIGWFEVHAENYMGAGGPPHHYLTAICEIYPLSIHGVGLSIGSDGPLDQDHLERLKTLCARYQPGLFSEHLAWSTHDDVFLNDLLPVPYNQVSLQQVCDHIDEVQEKLGRRMLLENPSTYIAFESSDMEEVDFLSSIVQKTGCGLLLDVNNVYISATNHAYSAEDYLENFPLQSVEEIHLAGHAEDEGDEGEKLLIDAHDRHVIDPVWELYRAVIAKVGPKPTLIEWDNDIPAWAELFDEAQKAENILLKRHGHDIAAE